MTTPTKSAAEVIAWSLEDRGLSPSDWSGHYADKVQEALDAAGYAIVPKEATQEMIEASWEICKRPSPEERMALEMADNRTAHFVKAAHRYAAMIAAATTPKED